MAPDSTARSRRRQYPPPRSCPAARPAAPAGQAKHPRRGTGPPLARAGSVPTRCSWRNSAPRARGWQVSFVFHWVVQGQNGAAAPGTCREAGRIARRPGGQRLVTNQPSTLQRHSSGASAGSARRAAQRAGSAQRAVQSAGSAGSAARRPRTAPRIRAGSRSHVVGGDRVGARRVAVDHDEELRGRGGHRQAALFGGRLQVGPAVVGARGRRARKTYV